MNAISLTSKPTLFAIIFAFSIVRHDLIHGASALARGEATPEVMTLSALESSWDWLKLTLTISGSVQLKRGSLSIRCDHAKILFRAKDSTLSKDHTFPQEDPTASVLSWGDHSLELTSIEANGNVKLTQRSLSLHAQKIIYHHQEKSIKAVGEVKGQWKDHRLSGRDLEINLDRGEAALRQLYLVLETGSLSDSMKSLFSR